MNLKERIDLGGELWDNVRQRKGEAMSVYNVIVHEEEGRYWAEVPDLPGCYTEADTLDELQEMLKDAISVYLADGEEVPQHSSMMQVAV